MTKAIIHPRPAQGSTKDPMRPTSWSQYGDSMYATAATNRPGPRSPRVRHRYTTPAPAPKSMAPTHSRWPTHRGTPNTCTAQKKGPRGKRKPICSWVTVPRPTVGSHIDAD